MVELPATGCGPASQPPRSTMLRSTASNRRYASHRMTATADSWSHLPEPAEREPLQLEAQFTAAEFDKLRLGLVPKQMEDKWFIYFGEGWLHFHRSWSGVQVFGLRLEASPTGVRVTDSWVNRNMAQYRGQDVSYEQKLVRFLIDALLLEKRDAKFPVPTNLPAAPAGLYQHSVVGRNYPEKSSGDNAKP